MNILHKSRKYVESHRVLSSIIGLSVLFLLACFVIYLRRPDALRHAQFWAEDGAFWYADAYNFGPWKPLFEPRNGYFQTVSKIVADLSLLIPLRWAPLFFNSCAIAIQALPVVFLWSKRFSAQVPSILARGGLTILYVGIPNSFEVNANITNAHWKLAVLAFMILIAKPASNKSWSIFDYIILILSAFSGPFSIIMAPLALVYWLRNRNWHTLRTLAIISAGALTQFLSVLLSSKAGRSTEQLAANWDNFTKIFGGQVIGSSLFGMYHLPMIYLHHKGPLLLTMIGLTVLAYTLIRAKLEIKLFIVFTFLVFAASLASPMISVTEPQWEVLARRGAGVRYYFLPILGWFVALIWLAGHRPRLVRGIGIAILCLSLIGLIYDFHYTSFVQYGFRAQAEQFANTPAGTREVFLLNPGEIPMTLVKH